MICVLLQGDPGAGPGGALGGGMNLGGMDIGSLLNNPTLMNMVNSLQNYKYIFLCRRHFGYCSPN